MSENTCNTCRWWCPIGIATREQQELGDCRCKAPMLVQGHDGRRHACHPRTVELHFCGSWRPRRDAEAADA